VQLVGSVIAVEGRATGVDTGLSPVNLFSDPRFGRYHEGYSPDPALTAKLGVAMVLGLQGGPSGGQGASTYLPSFNASIIAQAKHLAAYGHPSGGLNSGRADITNRSLLNVYMRPWRSMVAGAGLRSLMVSHQTVHDIPAHANAWLINTLMRDEYGFGDGFTISDEMNIGNLGPWGWAVSTSRKPVQSLSGLASTLICRSVRVLRWK
jgi:beta-glucosidase